MNDSSETTATQQKSAVRRWLPVGLLILGLVLFFALDLGRYFSFEWLAENYQGIKQSVAENLILACVIFFFIYAVSVAFSLPIASLLTLAGGAIFGWLAIPLVVGGATLGALVIFLAAKGALADTLSRKAGPFMTKIQDGFNTSPFFWLLALRLIPVAPFWVVNIVPALLGMKTRDYTLATLIGIAPGSTAYVLAGVGIVSPLDRGQVPDLKSVATDPNIIIALAALGCLALIPIVFKSFKKKEK